MRPDIPWIIKNRIIHRTPPFEPRVKALIKTLKGEVFIDIGCNTGLYSMLALTRFKRVYSIDPNPKYGARFQYAISNFNGFADFYIYSDIGSADSLVRNPHILGVDYDNSSKKIRVPVMTLDAFCEKFNMIADTVKIDVEDGEFEIIDGIREWFPRRLIIELHDERRKTELIDVMGRKGYKDFRIDETHFLFLGDERLWEM